MGSGLVTRPPNPTEGLIPPHQGRPAVRQRRGQETCAEPDSAMGRWSLTPPCDPTEGLNDPRRKGTPTWNAIASLKGKAFIS